MNEELKNKTNSLYNEDRSINKDVLENEIKWRQDLLSRIAYHTKSTLKIKNELIHLYELKDRQTLSKVADLLATAND